MPTCLSLPAARATFVLCQSVLVVSSFGIATGMLSGESQSLFAAIPSTHSELTSSAPVHTPNFWDWVFGYEIHSPADECTAVPEFNFAHCCGQHDIAYQVGGTWLDRLHADRALRDCIWNSGKPFLAIIYFLGVRLFGWLFYNFQPRPTNRKRTTK